MIQYKCIFFLFAFLVYKAYSQNETKNYIANIVYLDETKADSVIAVQYYDDLLRKEQLVVQGNNTTGVNLNSHIEYDVCDRISVNWLPVKNLDNLNYMSLSEIQESQTYSEKPFSTIAYDVLDRPVFETVPGEAWTNKGRITQYTTNGSFEVRRYTPEDLTGSNYYSSNTLFCVVNIDEDNHRSLTFTDTQNRIILQRKELSSDNLDTYYVYDSKGQLVYVLSPMYQTNSDLDKFAFEYTYNPSGLIKSKKIPGCDPVFYYYDAADRLIAEQDGILKKNAFYRRYEYDHLSRLTCQSISTAESKVYDEISNYYDAYSFIDSLLTGEAAILMKPSASHYSYGMPTGTVQRASNGERVLFIYGYDNEGRQNWIAEKGLNNRISVTQISFNHWGGITKKETFFYAMTGGDCVLKYHSTLVNKYDAPHTKLCTSSFIIMSQHQKNAVIEDTITIMNPTYDSFGHVVTKDREGINSDMYYAFDSLHGWIKQLGSMGGFEQELHRESGGHQNYYNGTISAMSWKDPLSGVRRRYDYVYDGYNRLVDASYGEDHSTSGSTSASADYVINIIPSQANQVAYNKYGEHILYDANSNVTSLQRYGMLNDKSYGLIDDLTVVYNGNRRARVTDNSDVHLAYTGASDFVDYPSMDEEYEYDANGALIKDQNRGINNMEYDLLGNPKTITMTNHRSIHYVYSADGRRLRTVHSKPRFIVDDIYNPIRDRIPFPQSTLTSVSGKGIGSNSGLFPSFAMVSDSTDYFGDFLFHNGHPQQYHFDGGYVSFSADTVDGFHYYIQDYQGNIRMVVNGRTDSIEQITNYYPYGGVIGDISINESLQPYKFEGKELDRTFGLDNYDIHARQYFAMAPMWDRVDPLAEKYYGISPYAYCAGDPVNLVDTDGREPTMEEAGQMSSYMYGKLDLKSISGGWNLVYHLQEQQDGYTAALFSRTVESTTEYTFVFRGTVGELDGNDWFTNLVEQPLGISTQFSKSMNDAMILNCRFPNNELTFVGHSKAGGQAEAAAIATSRKALTLNSSGISEITRNEAVILNTIGKIAGEIPFTSTPEIKNYVTLFDPLNLGTAALHFLPFVPRKSGSTYILPHPVGHDCKNFY